METCAYPTVRIKGRGRRGKGARHSRDFTAQGALLPQRSQVRTQCHLSTEPTPLHLDCGTWILSSLPPCPVFCCGSMTRLTASRMISHPAYQLIHCLPFQSSLHLLLPHSSSCQPGQRALEPSNTEQTPFLPWPVFPASLLKPPATDFCLAPFYHLTHLSCFGPLCFL